MKKFLTAVALVFLACSLSAQTDFSGKWKLSKEKSTLNEQFSMAPSVLVVTQNGNDFSLERHVSFQGEEMTINDKFTLDGKECINEGMMDSKKKSTTKFSDDKTALTIDTKFPMQDGGDIIIKEVFSIDNGNLVIESSSTSPWGESKEKMVFTKE